MEKGQEKRRRMRKQTRGERKEVEFFNNYYEYNSAKQFVIILYPVSGPDIYNSKLESNTKTEQQIFRWGNQFLSLSQHNNCYICVSF